MQSLLKKIAEVLRLSRMKKRWRRVMRLLAIVVAFCTTYMLILPAITMDNITFCGIENHEHTEECYIDPDGNSYLSGAYSKILFSTLGSTRATINYTDDLHDFIIDVKISDKDGVEISSGDTVYIGEEYNVSLEFYEDNEGSEWNQFQYNDAGYLTYQIPSNFKVIPFEDWHSITAKTSTGTIENVGEYFVDENGLLRVRFYEVSDGNGGTVNFIDKYSNTDFSINFDTVVATSASGTTTEINFGDQIDVVLNVDGGAGMNVSKTHGNFDYALNQMEYTVRVEATHGVVKNLVVQDEIWENHYVLRDTIVVTDFDGNVLDPQPTISDHPSHASGANEGFQLSGFPDFSAGHGYLITYKSQIYNDIIASGAESTDMWNGLYTMGNDSNGTYIDGWTDDWLRIEFKNLEKEGQQVNIEDDNGDIVSVLEWEVEILNSLTDMNGTVVIDTLGDGLAYYQEKSIKVRCYDQDGNRTDVMIPWSDVTVNGNSMSFDLPSGYSYDITYYTTYTPLANGEETKYYYNTVKTVINGKEVETGGSGLVVGFNPTVTKTASGDDGEYVYYNISTFVPATVKDMGHFYLTDLMAFWGYPTAAEHLYVDNKPEDMVIIATKEDGTRVTYTPYVEGGPTENTYILKAPAMDGANVRYHSFEVFFNTATASYADSRWNLNEDATLSISYKIPFDSKTGTDWYGTPTGNETLGDVLNKGYKVANEAYFNFSQTVTATGSVPYEYSPKITKGSVVNESGEIDYTVTFNNTIPGTHGDGGYVDAATNNVTFVDTFDPMLEYVPGSLMVTVYDPWREGLWLCKYRYNGTVEGNTIRADASDFVFEEYNYAGAQYDANGNELWGTGLAGVPDYMNYIKWMDHGGEHVFTYELKLKDEYLNTTEHAVFRLDNTAEVIWDHTGSSGPAKNTAEFETGLVDKHVVQHDNILDFDIHINANALDLLENASTITILDTMTKNLSVYWDTIKLLYQDTDGSWIDFDSDESEYTYTVTFDAQENRLTFVLPDSLHMRIDYSTLITESGRVSVNNVVKIEGKAEVSDIVDAEFHVDEHSGDASGSIHEMTLLKHDGLTLQPLKGAVFALYGPMGDASATLPQGLPEYIETEDRKQLHYIGSYTTGDDGTAQVSSQYLTIGGPYAYVETVAPSGYDILTEPVYFYFYEADPDGKIQTVTTLITIDNVMYGYVLPETGGTGTGIIYIIGGLLITLSAVFLLCQNKKRRERRRKGA